HRGLPRPAALFSHDTAPPESYTLSLHDALPIWKLHTIGERQLRTLIRRMISEAKAANVSHVAVEISRQTIPKLSDLSDHRFYSTDRKSTRLNSSHVKISYAVFCLKKKKTQSTSE